MLTPEAIAWAKARGISQNTLIRAGVQSGQTEFPGHGRLECLAFPHHRAGSLINVKYRALSTKLFKQRPGGEARLWLQDQALEHDIIYITEGEIDALSLLEAGLLGVVSLPMGAGGNHEYLRGAIPSSHKVVLALDADEPGRKATEVIASILGRGRCWYVDWSKV